MLFYKQSFILRYKFIGREFFQPIQLLQLVAQCFGLLIQLGGFLFPVFSGKHFIIGKHFQPLQHRFQFELQPLFSGREALRDKHHSMLGFPA